MHIAIITPEVLDWHLLHFLVEIYSAFGYFYHSLAYSEEKIDFFRQMLDKELIPYLLTQKPEFSLNEHANTQIVRRCRAWAVEFPPH